MSDSPNDARPLAGHPIVTGIVGFCAGLLIAYGVGLWQRSSALQEQAEANTATIAAKDAALAASAARLAESELATRAAFSATNGWARPPGPPS